jgi:ADP-heptose:LPS heptosyltransferase
MTSDVLSLAPDPSHLAPHAAPRRVILRSSLSVGDIVCLTAAVRELHAQYPGEFLTDVRTPFPELWEHNPHLTSLQGGAEGGETLDLQYDRDPYVSVNRSNQHPVHLIEGYCADLADQLELPALRPRELKGDVHLSDQERSWMSIPHERFNVQRYWVLCAGGKKDFTVKWWLPEAWQAVVDHFRGRIQFVQIGTTDDPWHWHPDLRGVLDLRGKTNLRQLVRLVHSASGVVSGITAVMHLAAAVPLPTWQHRPRPCVVIAGGREPRTWYGYQSHRLLETVGALPCCANGGCWHARTVKLNDGKDGRLCERVVDGHPKCMHMITPAMVIDSIETYLKGVD